MSVSSLISNMGSLQGILQRPVLAFAALTVASASTDHYLNAPSSCRSPAMDNAPSLGPNSKKQQNSSSSSSSSSWVSDISVSKLADLSFVFGIRVQVPTINFSFYSPGKDFVFDRTISISHLLNSCKFVDLAQGLKPSLPVTVMGSSYSPNLLYRWHLPDINSIDVSGRSSSSSPSSLVKSSTVVVLLGWLGSKQKHLGKYADWYTHRGFHVITFTLPMSDVISFQVGGKGEEYIDMLVNHLAGWLEEEHGKNLVFHTFSNTGWLTYGLILDKFQKHEPSLLGRIRGCVVDSAPVAAPDPQVWASGFSAALLKKRSTATKSRELSDVQPTAQLGEKALLVVLEKIFRVILNLPSVNRRLNDVLDVLSWRQPGCPQLYIYSSADRVIPAESVESFVDQQRKFGRSVKACNFISTPHVDHFRNDPHAYSLHLSQFLDDCFLSTPKNAP